MQKGLKELKDPGGHVKISIDDKGVYCSEESFVNTLMHLYCGESASMHDFVFDL